MNSRGQSMLCLICGGSDRQTLNALDNSCKTTNSKIPVSKLLKKILNEEPNYEASKRLCLHCFLMIDQMDSLQSKMLQIKNYLAEKYVFTKSQIGLLKGSGTNFIESSLSNIEHIQSGTTLNLNSELSVTVLHGKEKKPNENIKSKQVNNGSSFSLSDLNILKRKTENQPNSASKKLRIIQLNKENGVKKVEASESSAEEGQVINGCVTISRKGDKNNVNDSYVSSSEGSYSEGENATAFSLLKSKFGETSKNVMHDYKSGTNSEIYSSESENEDAHIQGNKQFHSEQPSFDMINSQLQKALMLENSDILQTFLSTSLWMAPAGGSAEFNKAPSQEILSPAQPQVLSNTADVNAENDLLKSSEFDKETRLKLKNTGRSYINTKGALIQGKKIIPSDCSRCVLKCTERISEEMRKVIFDNFWSLGDFELQREYLAANMNREERITPMGSSVVKVNYYLKYKDKRMNVCRQFFQKTLDVSEKSTRNVLKKKSIGLYDNLIENEKKETDDEEEAQIGEESQKNNEEGGEEIEANE